MRLPSIHFLIANARESFLRFPLTLLSSIIAVITAIYLVEYHQEIENIFPYVNFLLVAALGIPLYFCCTIINNKFDVGLTTRSLIMLGATGLLTVLYFSLPSIDITHNTYLAYIRYGIYNIIIHLLISFIPYLSNNQLNGFWNYNKTLFIRLCLSVLYSGFLYVGLVLALVALKQLFNIKIHEELFFEIFIVIIGVFNTWFFIAGIPKELNQLESIKVYPKGLKLFAQFILLPLLSLYLLILYGYGAKIFFQWNWPKGMVSYLISCVAVLGIFTILLIYPYGNLKGNEWMKKFSRFYYFLLFPLIVILFIAVGMRIGDYGITINRYVIVLLGVWLTIICLYFSIGKVNIKFIPKSLAVLLLLMSFGPWGMFSVSEKSQVNRLVSLLEDADLLVNQKVINEVYWKLDSAEGLKAQVKNTNVGLVNDSVHNEIFSILNYLDNHHGFSKIRPLFRQNIDSIIRESLPMDKHINEASIYMESLGMMYRRYYPAEKSNNYNYSAENVEIKSVSGYDFLVGFHSYGWNENDNVLTSFTLDSTNHTLKYLPKENNALLFISNKDTIQFNLNKVINDLRKANDRSYVSDIAQDKMTLIDSSFMFKVKIEMGTINIINNKDTLRMQSGTGSIFIKQKL